MHILRRMSKHLKAISLGSMALAAVGAIGWGVCHFRESRTMKTDDCRVEASIVSVGSKLAERVTSVDVEEGETVRRGQTLAHLDSRTMQARLMAARSRVKLMQARHDEMLAGFRPQEIESQRARTAQASASLEHARRDYERVEKLVREQAGISSADRDAVRATYLAAQALEKAEQENLALKLEGYREEEKRSAQAQLEAIRAQIAREKQIAQTEIANEREAAIREMRNEVVTLSMAVAEKLLQKNMDPDMNAKLVADCIDQLQTHRVKGN